MPRSNSAAAPIATTADPEATASTVRSCSDSNITKPDAQNGQQRQRGGDQHRAGHARAQARGRRSTSSVAGESDGKRSGQSQQCGDEHRDHGSNL